MELCHAVLNIPFSGPTLDHWTLPNGVRCVTADMPDAPLTCLDLWCRAGSASEHPGEEGMAHFLEHMVFKGSERLAAGAFDEAIEALGGSSNAATGFDDVHFHVLTPPDRAREALDLLLELVLQPSLDPGGFSTERGVVLEEIAQYADQPNEQVLQLLLSKGCDQHPYGRPILGTPLSLEAMTPSAMEAFHKRQYRGSNCCLAVAGPASTELRSAIGSSALAGLLNAPAAAAQPAPLSVHPGHHSVVVDRLESARLLMLWEAPQAQDQGGVMAADLATTLLGEGRRSRLVNRLREELQIVESVSMDLSVLEQGSLITLEVICPNEHLDAVEEEVNRELRTMARELVTDQELKRGQQLVSNGLRYALESTGQVSGLCASQTLWDRQQDLLHPLAFLPAWTVERLRSELFPRLQPEQAFVLTAQAKSEQE
jgi:predicted Zn-dependent peptidase